MDHNDEVVSVERQVPVPISEQDLEQLWRSALGEIEVQISRPNFITWFKNSRLTDKRDNTAIISLPNNFAKEWIENKYCKVVLGALRALEESIKKVEFVVTDGKQRATITVRASAQESTTQMAFPEFKIDGETNLNPRYTLSSFIVGKSNELSHAAASAVVDEVGKKYNPLFIYGGVGLGKTHLMQAVGNEIRSRYEGKVRVKYVSSEKFTNDVIWAIRNKRMETIKEKYRLVDVLIIDDIQFIIGKVATEEEFFHTFNALYENNKQIIISSDKAPKFMPNLEERLRSRFEGGMIADIGYPDYELRWAILKNKVQERGASLPDELISLMASKIQRNFRELEGVLNRVLFHHKTRGGELPIKVAEEIINELVHEPSVNISPANVLKAVADVFKINLVDIIGSSRKREFVEPRQVSMFLLREMLDLSYPNIGERMGKRDHTTALYAFEKISQEINKNQNLSQKILMIKELIMKE